jgi:hypothetical protein
LSRFLTIATFNILKIILFLIIKTKQIKIMLFCPRGMGMSSVPGPPDMNMKMFFTFLFLPRCVASTATVTAVLTPQRPTQRDTFLLLSLLRLSNPA